MTISAILVTALVTLFLPAIVSFVTKSSASAGIKQFVTAVLSAVTGLIVTSTQLDGTAVLSKEAALLALSTFITTQATYWGLWKPHAINAKLNSEFGIG